MNKTPEPKRMGRPELPPEERTKPRTIWMTDAEWAKVQAAPKGWVRGLVQLATRGSGWVLTPKGVDYYESRMKP